jgi:SAM-dependent methyltransferase
MLRYRLAAAALKAFSLNAATKSTYRHVTNVLGSRARRNRNLDAYLQRGALFLDLCRKYQAMPPGGKGFELGTGWLHFYSLYLRLFYDARITMLDVWDNRQLEALTATFARLREALPETVRRDPHATAAFEAIAAARSLEDLYARLGLEHIIEPTGIPSRCASGTYDLIFSFHVLEHVPAARVGELLGHFHRMLRPGGVMIHQIGIDDHLAHYDAKQSPKTYLQYSDRTWRRFFENDVQYFNRLQRSEWLRELAAHGFEFCEEMVERTDLDGMPIDDRFKDYPRLDLECTILTVVHRKPLAD